MSLANAACNDRQGICIYPSQSQLTLFDDLLASVGVALVLGGDPERRHVCEVGHPVHQKEELARLHSPLPTTAGWSSVPAGRRNDGVKRSANII